MTAIRAVQLGKSYRHFEVLKEVSLEIEPGQCYALFGSNGAGKTTLLKVLATLQKPSRGRFEIVGFDGVAERSRIRTALLLIAHGSYLYNDLDAVENLRFSLSIRGLSPTDREIKIALDRVGIGAFSEFKVRYFSEGMKRRLALARSILIRPRVLLMDEPYSSLDEDGMSLVNQFLRTITREGAAVLMTSHNRVQSAGVAHRAGVLHQGVLREIGLGELRGTNELF